MPSHRQGLTTQDKPLSGQGDVLGSILSDLGKLEFGTYVVAESTPTLPDDGLLWFQPSTGVFKYWSASAVAWKLVDVGGAGGLAAHIAATPIDHPDASVTAAKLAANAVTTAKIADANVTTAKILDANVTAAKLAAGAADDTAIGSRTAIDTTGSPSMTGGLLAQLSSLWTTLKAMKGTAGALTAPPTTLTAAKAHADSAAPHSGHQTPAGSQAQIDAHNAAQGAHGLFSGAGSPEGVVTAAVGSLYRDTTNGTLYVKRTGAGNTGWGLNVGIVIPQSISCVSYPPFGPGDILQVSGFNPSGSSPYPANNLAILVPFSVPTPMTAKRMFIWLASASGNLDVAIYDASFNRVVSKGSTAAAGTFMFLDIADTPLAAGSYYMAINCSTTACTFHAENRNHLTEAMRAAGCVQMAVGAIALPATITPAAIANDFLPFMGIEVGALQ